MISFFRKKKETVTTVLQTDMHSHLLAGLDDGVKSHEEAIEIILGFQQLGYKKIITTPHIMNDFYPNEPEQILAKLDELNQLLKERGIEVTVEAASEYFLDENLMLKLNEQKTLLSFSNKHLLFETNFFSEPYQLNEFIFKAITQGYKPILAHPERYQYMTMAKAQDLKDRGVLLQLNILSLIGYYGKPVEKMAVKLIDAGLIDMLGSDCHNQLHYKALQESFKTRSFKKALDLRLLNNFL